MADIRDRIAKLLALADSPNENEAREALVKARQLMAEHKLTERDVCITKEVKVIRREIGVTCSKRRNSWAVPLSARIAENYCCKAFRSRLHGKQTFEIGLIGLDGDFEVCERIFKYAHDFVDAECKKIRKQYRDMHTAAYLNKLTDAYGVGFIDGLKVAFRKQVEEHQEYGLVLVIPKEVREESETMDEADYKEFDLGGTAMQFARAGYRDGVKFDPSTKLAAAGE